MTEKLAITEEQADSVVFSETKQDAILGHLLLNDKFFVQCFGKITSKWFLDPNNSAIYALKCDYYSKYKRCCTIAEIKNHPSVLSEDVKTKNRIYAKIQLAEYKANNEFALDALIPELTSWLHARIYHTGISKSLSLYNSRKQDEAEDILKNVVREISDTSFYQDNEVRFDNYLEFNERRKAQIDGALTFGNSMIDKLLNPDAPNGGLLRGDTTIILAPTNIGKSTSLITIARHNILRGQPVLWITHEGTINDLQTKMWCSMLNVSRAQLYAMLENPESYAKFDEKIKWFNDFLTFIPINKAGLAVEEVDAIIRKRQEERVLKYGEGYALLIDDYPAKLTTKRAAGGNLAKRNSDEIVYDYFVSLALEYNFHSLLAIQTNRDGSKVNDHQRGAESRLVGMEDVAESWGPMTIATNVISLNRDAQAESSNRLTWYICKSRSNYKGWAIVCRSNFANCITHSNELGATYYRSKSTMTEKIDYLLNQYAGQEIPKQLWTD